jgi:hypothetical protein
MAQSPRPGGNGPQRSEDGPPAQLPRSPRVFWAIHPQATMDPPDAQEPRSALESLGPPPFPKSGFPFIGFLATVYDHVAAHAGPRQVP